MFKPGIVVSIQPRWNSPFNAKELIVAYAVECSKYATALRIEGINNVLAVVERLSKLHGPRPSIIGLVKHKVNELNTYITPSVRYAEALIVAGAKYVAMECSDRLAADRIGIAVKQNIPVIADVGTYEDAVIAKDQGVLAVTTALSGYLNKKTHPFVEPDIAIVKRCAGIGLPIIAEGRYRTPVHLKMACEAGAHAVCIGDAIHEPRNITLYSKIFFDGSWKEHSKNDYLGLN